MYRNYDIDGCLKEICQSVLEIKYSSVNFRKNLKICTRNTLNLQANRLISKGKLLIFEGSPLTLIEDLLIFVENPWTLYRKSINV